MERHTVHVLLTSAELLAVEGACPTKTRLSAWLRQLALRAAGWSEEMIARAELSRVEALRANAARGRERMRLHQPTPE